MVLVRRESTKGPDLPRMQEANRHNVRDGILGYKQTETCKLRKNQMSKFRFELNTAGHSQGNLVCSSLHSRCGDIEDGIGLEFGREGSWVIEFTDLETLYHMALVSREQRSKYAQRD